MPEVFRSNPADPDSEEWGPVARLTVEAPADSEAEEAQTVQVDTEAAPVVLGAVPVGSEAVVPEGSEEVALVFLAALPALAVMAHSARGAALRRRRRRHQALAVLPALRTLAIP